MSVSDGLGGTMSAAHGHAENPTRRDFIYVATTAFGAVGAAMAAWPLVAQMAPDRSALATGTTEVDLSKVAEGQSITVTWRGKPVFIRHRTAADITAARSVDLAKLPDPQADTARTQKPEWLVVVGVCTHLGCIPNAAADSFGGAGWFCPCHGSKYDTSARIRQGPAPRNLDVPSYAFLTDTKIRIG
jgi:ubiquinol-cytochrome c reductase iron-sulfur subunit